MCILYYPRRYCVYLKRAATENMVISPVTDIPLCGSISDLGCIPRKGTAETQGISPATDVPPTGSIRELSYTSREACRRDTERTSHNRRSSKW
jgi:hypothetical protein